MVQNDKKLSPLCSISQKPYIVWLLFMVHIFKMVISPGVLFLLFKILIFWVIRGVKGQKMTQNDKKFCQAHLVSQEPYIIWLSFMVNMCEMIISPVGFFSFSKFWFFGVVRGVKCKKQSKMTKMFCLLHSISQEPCIIWLSSMVHVWKMTISKGVFFMFSKFWFSWSIGG